MWLHGTQLMLLPESSCVCILSLDLVATMTFLAEVLFVLLYFNQRRGVAIWTCLNVPMVTLFPKYIYIGGSNLIHSSMNLECTHRWANQSL